MSLEKAALEIKRVDLLVLNELTISFHELATDERACDKATILADKDRDLDSSPFFWHELIGYSSTDENSLRQEFNRIDTNHGGYILFDEFCIYMAKKKLQ
ncbi:unnamed protein product [Rotaria sordida]|uniref:EF-hand domain-containing protein n=2 Tax=Rotaria sordida TaxID=392033 RepID=A0A814U2S4_9BILA|nr:unnamed protein product [Rotaria sordida]